jgi:hypothetical protein
LQLTVGLLAFVGVGFSSLQIARAVRPRSLHELLLTAALAAYVFLILAGFGLTAIGSFDRRGWLIAVLALVIAGWAVRSLGDPGEVRILGVVRDVVTRAGGDPLLVAMALVAGIALGYELALALITPAAEGDALAYHLTRAAAWLQQHGIGAVAGSRDPRIDESPPGAEIAVAFTMAATGGTRAVGLVQWWAVLVAALGVYGVSVRLGADRRASAFAALCVPMLPIVALQAPSALNDIVVGALVITTAYFLLDPRRSSTVLAFMATAALVTTKLTALVGVFVLALIAITAGSRRHRIARLVAVLGGAFMGSIWLVGVRLAQAHGTIGGVPTDYRGSLNPVAVVGRLTRLLLEYVEIPGAIGADVFVLVLAGIGVIVAGLMRSDRRDMLVVGVCVACTALVVPGGYLFAAIYRKAWFEVGRHDLELLGTGQDPTKAASTYSWFVAIGLAVVIAGCAMALRRRRWKRQPTFAVIALAPVLWTVGLAGTLGYSDFQGRFAIGGMLLGLAAVAPVFTDRRVVVWAVTVSAVAAVLVFVNSEERPAGIRLLDRDGPAQPSVWTRSDALAQGPVPGMSTAIQFTNARIPRTVRLAMWATPFPDDPAPGPIVVWPYPFYGTSLSRTILLVTDLRQASELRADWALLPAFTVTGCHDGWRRETARSADFQAFRRDAAVRC